MTIQLLQGDCKELLETLPDKSVQMICTSPPYWRLRRYTNDSREIGQEPTPAAYVAALVDVFERCRRVLRDDGTLWLNLGDAYADDSKWGGSTGGKHANGLHGKEGPGRRKVTTGLPPKSLIGLPWRVAFALQDAGWVLRNEIIWWKRNAMPEGNGARDRFSRDHETVFVFTKASNYYIDMAAVRVPAVNGDPSPPRGSRGVRQPNAGRRGGVAIGERLEDRHARTVWDIPARGLRAEHYAPMPQALAERCIKAGSRPGDTVLDPFAGSGTTGRAALALQRSAILIDLAYTDLQERRTDGVQVQMVDLL